jgi:hypothetical protein
MEEESINNRKGISDKWCGGKKRILKILQNVYKKKNPSVE